MHVQKRALACFILNFLETACSRKYTRNIYHEALFQTFIVRENEDDRSLPPYFKGDFFPTIKRIRNAGLNLEKVTLREIYSFLLEEVVQDDQAELLPFKVEIRYPLNNWEKIWKLARQKMMDPNLNSFLFKLLHEILPTAERVARILPNHSPACNLCTGDNP